MRLADARKDRYRRLAKDQGYRSRSAYKLLQINKSYKILKKGLSVVDLGSAPGGWVQVTQREVGSSGKVVGIDLKEIEPINGAVLLQGDIQDPAIAAIVIDKLDSKADVLLSDLAPNVSGVWDIDHARQISLTKTGLMIAHRVLRKGGNAVFKVFEGSMLEELKSEMRHNFERIQVSKPEASRQESSEMYLVCFNFRAGDALQPKGEGDAGG
jgi:23S rRNA (uridine2552-2'-O)-methyltransferase